MKKHPKIDREALIERCLSAFVQAGSLDLSLDQLANAVGISKRMLVHYFGGREAIEEQALSLLEDRLRAQFSPQNFPQGVSAQAILNALWDRTVDPKSRGVLLLIMNISNRAWSGSSRARAFYQEQQELWKVLLMRYLPESNAVEDILQTFQGAILTYLITNDPEPGRRMIHRLSASGILPRHLDG